MQIPIKSYMIKSENIKQKLTEAGQQKIGKISPTGFSQLPS